MTRRLTETDLATIHLALMTLLDIVAADPDSSSVTEWQVGKTLNKIQERMK